MEITTSYLLEKFNEFNRLYFNNEVKLRGGIKLNKRKTSFGLAFYRDQRIEISVYCERDENDYLNTLIHEMCHHYCWQKYRCSGHKGMWKTYAAKLTQMTNGKYGNIQRCGGGNKKCLINQADAKMNDFVVFTDYKGEISIIRFTDDRVIRKVIERQSARQENSEVVHIKSAMGELGHLQTHRYGTYSLRWYELKKLLGGVTLDRIIEDPTTEIVKAYIG